MKCEEKNIIEYLQCRIEESDKSVEELQCIFYEVAKKLMNEYVLRIGDLEVELKELEFYFFDCKEHSDTYTHLDKLQKETSEFLYVHKKDGNRGGIDITFGNGTYYGGILIRGAVIKNTFEDKYISGPNKFKEYLIKALKLDLNIGDNDLLQKYFIEIKEKISFQENDDKNELKENQIFNSTRVGLNVEKEPIYGYALYRFISDDYLKANENEFITKENRKNLKERLKIELIADITNIKTKENKTKHFTKELNEIKNKIQLKKCFSNKEN